ncbi:MAG: hypothetical protein IT223_04790 [Crocinitomicaceae bacterium]|nr:hypothetical protein [Crocinitomicaceae bacterium]
MKCKLIFFFCLISLFFNGQVNIIGTGADRGKFILNDGGKFIIAAEVEDPSTHPFKFLVFSTLSGTSLNTYVYKGGMPYAINDFIKNKKGNYIALGERYLEGNRESMLLIEMNPALSPVRAKASYENGNEVEPYDILEYGDSYFITGFTKTSQLMSAGVAYITKEKQQMYLTRYDNEFNQISSYIITGFADDVNPVGRQMALANNHLIIAGNIVGAEKSEAVVLSVNLITNQLEWSKRISGTQSLGVTDMIIHDGNIVIQCTTADKITSDHALIMLDEDGNLKKSWLLAEEGIQRSHCLYTNKQGELMLFGASGSNRFESKRAAYLFSTLTGKFRVNLQGDGIQSETGRATATVTGFTCIGYEFSRGKTGIDISLRNYQESTFSSAAATDAKELPVSIQPISLKIENFPVTAGIFKSELFFEDIKYEPYYIWHVE